ncbi:MAG: hypothetical protein HGA24_05830, partial [Candidatus Aminicenantes bacterium]|nr:hypothetical protein [Candidatus Aminicenantes bacterium]
RLFVFSEVLSAKNAWALYAIRPDTTAPAPVLRPLDFPPNTPANRDRVAVAWDEPGVGVPMLANLTPQAAILRELPKPSECDIVIVIFWSRMGTPLPPDPDWVKPEDGTGYKGQNKIGQSDASGMTQGQKAGKIIKSSFGKGSFRSGMSGAGRATGAGVCDGTGPKGSGQKKGGR